jgi:hypothetical protein
VISNKCETCHSILSETSHATLMPPTSSEPFKHPIDLGSLNGMACDTCHSGSGIR